MAEPKPPFFVRFAADPLPTIFDRSVSNPGPADGTFKAGFTMAQLRVPPLVVMPATTAPDKWDKVGLYFRAININFLFGNFKILLSSNLTPGSCQDLSTQRHEIDAHVVEPTKILYGFRDVLIERLNIVPVPTREQPERMETRAVKRAVETTRDKVQAILDRTITEVAGALFKAAEERDSPDAYAREELDCAVPAKAGARAGSRL